VLKLELLVHEEFWEFCRVLGMDWVELAEGVFLRLTLLRIL
jgi:hypothetical protein